MWAIEQEIVEGIRDHHHNGVRLPSVETLPATMTATGDRAEAVQERGHRSRGHHHAVRTVALVEFKGLIPDRAIVVSLMKGIERSTNKRMDEVVANPSTCRPSVSPPFPDRTCPRRSPTASRPRPWSAARTSTMREGRRACTTDYFKPFVTTDVIGLEMCGSLKNVTALAVGMARGAGYGENTAAMIETRGLAELTALGVAAGADPKTFFGLAGVGDLIATCGSPLSRNYTFGANLGKGLSVEEATKVSNGVAEGVPTTDAVVALGEQFGVPTPLATAMSRVLNEGISCAKMLAELFGD